MCMCASVLCVRVCVCERERETIIISMDDLIVSKHTNIHLIFIDQRNTVGGLYAAFYISNNKSILLCYLTFLNPSLSLFL